MTRTESQQKWYRLHGRERYQLNKKQVQESCWKYNGIKTAAGEYFTFVDFDRLYQQQQGRCKICRKHQSELKNALCVDHDHKTNLVRGLLCRACNNGIGLFKDQSDLCTRAAHYLKQELSQ